MNGGMVKDQQIHPFGAVHWGRGRSSVSGLGKIDRQVTLSRVLMFGVEETLGSMSQTGGSGNVKGRQARLERHCKPSGLQGLGWGQARVKTAIR